MVAQNPNQMIPQRGHAMCYKEDCPSSGVKQCRAIICCKDYGCGRMMCDNHTSRKCIARNGKHGPPQHVCKKCEPEASRCTKLIFMLPISCMICFLVFFVAISIAGGSSGESSSRNSYYNSYNYWYLIGVAATVKLLQNIQITDFKEKDWKPAT